MAATIVTLEEERKKRPQVTDQDLQAFRDWVDKQPHLPTVSGQTRRSRPLCAAVAAVAR